VKVGDIVRFKPPYYIDVIDDVRANPQHHVQKTVVGLLVGFESWEGMAEILYRGEVFRVIARHVEKAGKKDEFILDNRAKTVENGV